MLKGSAARGFTMVELMVAVAIISIVLAISVPSFTIFLQGAKLSSSAQSYLTGIRMARTEAIHRNAPVSFLLTNDPVFTPALAIAALPSVTGQSWVVRWFNPVLGAVEMIEAKNAIEGSFTTAGVSSVQVVGTGAPVAFAGTMVFNGFGATNSAYALALSNPNGGACAPVGPMRCPTVVVSAGGLSRVCDPIVPVGDSRAC